ncbi:MAG: hypothetical protein CMN84_10040 [Spongiibacteraceae bacterium]|jgi:putative transposase|nr:hypothetical protein [Spongiibacteraceae bacterium]
MLNLAARSPVPDGFHIGDLFRIRGEEYVLTSVNAQTHEARLRPHLGGNDITLHADELVAWTKSAAITHTQAVSEETRHAVRLASLNDKEKWDWKRRCEYIKELLEYDTAKTRALVSRTIYKIFNRRTRRILNKQLKHIEKMPSISSVYNWIAIVRENNGYLAALAYKDHRSKPRKDRLHPTVSRIVEECIDMLLSPEKISVDTLKAVVKRFIKEANRNRTPNQELLRVPSTTTLRNRLNARNPMDVDRGKKGESYTIKHYNYGGKTTYPKYIGSRVEGDTNYIDCLVYDALLDITYRPLLLLFIDCYTKAVVGYEVSYLQRGSEKLAKAMTNMMSENDMASFSCVPVMVVVDNGKEFDNLTLKHIQDRTGIIFCFSPPYSPNCKSIIERFWGTLNSKLLHGLKGTTKENIFVRGYYDSEDNATYTIQELREKIDLAINEYHHTPHSSEILSPKTKWQDAAEKRPPRVYDRDTCIALGTRYVTRKVSHGRVQIDELEWRGAALPENFNGQYVTVCVNNSDLTNVWVINPDDSDDIHKLEPVDKNLQAGLSLEFWNGYRDTLQKREQASGNPAIAEDMRADIALDLIQAAKSGHGTTKRKRARSANAAAKQLENMSTALSSTQSSKESPLRTQPSVDGTSFDYGIED